MPTRKPELSFPKKYTHPSIPPWDRIGTNLQRIIDRKSTTQSELARKMGVTPSYINRITSGRKKVSIDRLAEIARKLEADIIELFYPH